MFNSVRKELVPAYLKREEEEAGRQTDTEAHTHTELGRVRQNEKNRGTNRGEKERGTRRHRGGKEVCVYIERDRG